jgi:outer membrane receptor protein involved in Fe transport
MSVRHAVYLLGIFLAITPPRAFSQTSATGQIAGKVVDPTEAVIANVSITVKNADTGAVRTVVTNTTGGYVVPVLPPGTYNLTVTAPGFKTITNTGVNVPAATSTTVNFMMEVGSVQQQVTVEAASEVLQTESSASGGTVNQATMVSLPLTNRNYTQILALSPGVAGQVPNAATLGRNTVNVNVNGGMVSDNSFQMDGQDVSNLQSQGGSDTVALGGISIPSPDAILEFRVQTSQYDASYGRGSGASVNVITKSGTNQLHGDFFEFLRNDDLNANDFFLNRNGQARPVLKQNQYGATLGGPIIKDKLFLFGSYQGTQQVNGQGAGSLQSVVLPALTNDRSAAALGKLFAGQKGQFGGTAVAADGSNINPVALTLLNTKLPNGTYLIPTPQVIQGNGQGLSVFSIPSRFTENQFLLNADYMLNSTNRISERFFYSRDPTLQSFTSSNVPGSALNALFLNSNFNLKWTDTITPALINELSVGYHRIWGQIASLFPVTDSQIGIPQPCNNPIAPITTITGSVILGGNGNDGQFANTKQYGAQDQVSWVHGSHNFRAGFETQLNQLPFADPNLVRGSLTFNGFPDFLLGLSAQQNGTAFSNVFSTSSTCGDTSHNLRVNDYAVFAQDDYKVTSRLTLNLGVRWDIYGQTSDVNGRLVDFWPEIAMNTFTNGQSYSGFVVPNNFKGTIPDGVKINDNRTFFKNPAALGSVGPRLGFSWQPGFDSRLVIRGGYGIYYGRTSVNDAYQQCCNQPFVQRIATSGVTNAAATFQNPWVPLPLPIGSYPVWSPRTPTSVLTLSTIAPDWTPPMLHQWSFNVQYKITSAMLLQAGYVGNHGSRIELSQSINQPFLASASNPVNGITVNTVANAPQRVPFLGFSPTGLSQRSFIGISNYDALQVSLQSRLSHGVQFQISYTYSKSLTDLVGYGVFPNTGSLYNNAHVPLNSYGPADFNIPQRFIAHFMYDVPGYKNKGLLNYLTSDWGVSGVVTIQNGLPLTFTDTRSGTIYGTSAQLAQLCPGMTAGNIVRPGPLKSNLDNYFNAGAFCAPPTFVDPNNASSIGYGFGSLGRGLVYGPGQYNSDLSLMRRFKVPGPESGRLEFRAEFYNAFNTPQFAAVTTTQGATPITRIGVANFGHISSTSVAPRLIQFGLKYLF